MGGFEQDLLGLPLRVEYMRMQKNQNIIIKLPAPDSEKRKRKNKVKKIEFKVEYGKVKGEPGTGTT